MPAQRPVEQQIPTSVPPAKRRKTVKVGAAAPTFEDLMNVTLTILGRAAVDAAYAELASTTVTVADAPVACTPAIPPAAAGQELALLVTSDDDVKVQLGRWIDPATRPGATPLKDYEGNDIGTDPAPAPSPGSTYVARARAPRQIPFSAGNSIVLARPGVATTA